MKTMRTCLILSLIILASACNETTDDAATCNNGVLEAGETCDGKHLNNKTCQDIDAKYTGGTLSCNASCQFDTTACTKDVVATCNNNGMLDAGEACDGQDFGGKVCADIDKNLSFGQLSCTQDCKISNVWCFANDVGLQSALPDAESTDALCSNGLNDYNAVDKQGKPVDWFDCNSYWCTQLPIVQACASLENTDLLCSNGRDDDMNPNGKVLNGNGLIDCEDPSCFKNPRVTVCHDTKPVMWELGDACKDGIDNDGDTLVDCDDLDCLHAGSPCELGDYKRILFDNAHHQVAGNADWIIDVTGRHPFPTIPLKEDDWHGHLSSWGKALIDTGHFVLETLPPNRVFSYGSDDVQDLKNYHVLISTDPSVNYSASEIKAIYDFVEAGGAFMMIADHAGSDRDANGWDSVGVLNDMFAKLTAEHGLNPFHFTVIENTSMSTLKALVNKSQKDHPILRQPHGVVTSVASYAGTAFEVLDESQVDTLLTVEGQAYAVSGKLGKGRFFAIGDSSIAGDATNSLGITQDRSGFDDKAYDNKTVLMNAVEWLALKD